MRSPQTEIEVERNGMLAGNVDSEGPSSPTQSRNPDSFRATVSPSTFAPTVDFSPSDVISPTSPNPCLSALTHGCSPINPMASSSSNQDHSVTEAGHFPDLGRTEYHHSVASLCRPFSLSPVGSAANELEHINNSVRVPSSGDASLFDSEPPSAMIDSCIPQGDISNPWNAQSWPTVPFSASLARNTFSDPSLMNGSTENMRAGMPLPMSTPVNVHDGDYDAYKALSPTGGSDPYSIISPLYSLQRHTSFIPLPQCGSDIFALVDEIEEALPSIQRPEKTPRTLTPSWLLPQGQMQKGQDSGGQSVSPEINVASGDQLRSNSSKIVTSLPSTTGQPHCFNHMVLSVAHCASKQTQVDELQVLVDSFNTVWMQALRSNPKLQLRCTALTPHALFEKGIMTFQKFLPGGFSHRFEDLFAFIHLAFAAAYSIHCQQNTCCVDDSFYEFFYKEALELQHALPDIEDKILFLQAMNCLWWLSSGQLALSSNDSRLTSLESSVPPTSTNRSHQTDPIGEMRHNGLFKACAGVCDGKSSLLIS